MIRFRRRAALPLTGLLGVAVLLAPPAAAGPDEQFAQGIAALRATGPCRALHHDPVAQRVAEISNRSTDDYLNHNARFVPVTDPLAVLNDLGSPARKAVQLQGFGRDDTTAIKGALLQGHAAILDCSYSTLGTSVIHNPADGHSLAVAVLASE